MVVCKKIYCLCLTLVAAFAPSVLFGYDLKLGPSGACYVIARVWPDADSFYYCGQQSTGCRGSVQGAWDSPHWYYNKGGFSYGGNTYWCCGGSTSSQGTWKSGSSWETGSRYTVKKDLGDGKTCNQTKVKNICGQEETVKDCNEPDGCSAGLIFRKVSSASGTSGSTTSTGVCVAPCSSGTAFESDTSTTCIECPTTNYQGISNEVCVKCDPATQFFVYDKSDGDVRTGRCISKNDTTKVSTYSKTDLQYGRNQTVNTTTVKTTGDSSGKPVACWVYSDAVSYKKCVLGELNLSSNSPTSSNNASYKFALPYAKLNFDDVLVAHAVVQDK